MTAAHTPLPARTPEPDGEPRVGVVAGDRLCARCAFNLVGQTIVREPRYGLLIARCPECGTPAPIQEYPLLGRWANRLSFVLGGAWLLMLFAFLGINVLTVTGFTIGVTQDLTAKYAFSISHTYAAYADANLPPSPAATYTATTFFPWGGTSQFDADWWRAQDHAAMFAEAGGWSGGVDWGALRQLLFPILFAAPFGMIWAVALPHAKGIRRAIPLALVMVIAVLSLVVHDWQSSTPNWRWTYMGAQEAAYEQLGTLLHLITLSAWVVVFTLGTIFGRAVARRVIVLFLPPRLRGPWSFLWLADGLALPRPT